MSSKNQDPKYPKIRITAIGDDSADKIKLLLAFTGYPSPEEDEYAPSVFENFHEMHTYQGTQYNMHLWDTAGQQEYDRLRPMFYVKTEVILMCFSLNDPDSLKNVTNKWIIEVREYCPKAAVILIGTHSELWNPNEDGAITQAQIDDVAKEIKAFKAFTCSVLKNENIVDIFDLAIQAYLEKKEEGNSNCNIA